MTAERQEVLVAVQGLRAFASVIVVLWHIEWLGLSDAGSTGMPPVRMFLFGNAGVDIFFVLSGFIMMVITSRDGFSAKRFFIDRAIRILPMYWLFTLAFFAMSIFRKHTVTTDDLAVLLKSILVLPQDGPPTLGVGWSLEHEAIFYLLVGVFLSVSTRKNLMALLGVLGLTGLAVHGAAADDGRSFDYHIVSIFHLDFLLGIVIFCCRDAGARVPAAVWLVGGTALLTITGLLLQAGNGWMLPTGTILIAPHGSQGVLRVLGYGVAGGLLLLGCLSLERDGFFDRHPALAGSALLLGNASFALYLVHPFVFGTARLVLPPITDPVLILLAKAGAVVGAVLAAVVFTRCVEQPSIRVIRRSIYARGARRVEVARFGSPAGGQATERTLS